MTTAVTIWDLLYSLDPTKRNRCEAIDPLLAEKIDSVDTLGLTGYYLNADNLPALLPETKVKINNIIQSGLKDTEQRIPSHQIRNFDRWLDQDTRKILVENWINEDCYWDTSWISQNVSNVDGQLQLKALEKLISVYNKRKSRYRIKDIENIFKNINSENLSISCKLLADGSPALSACLLSRKDIQEEYVILGLKALSKLSRQRDLPVEIDFFALKNLGPRSRLDAMKHLLGIAQSFGRYRKDFLPFKVVPTKEEVEEFLFPCAVKYNDEVSSIVKRYEELVNKTQSKEVNYG